MGEGATGLIILLKMGMEAGTVGQGSVCYLMREETKVDVIYQGTGACSFGLSVQKKPCK